MKSSLPTRRIRRAFAATALAAVMSVPALAVVTPASAAVPFAPAATTADASLRVATFNVRCANCSIKSRTNKREKRWSVRRDVIADQIRRADVDVIGIQEASPGLLPGTRIGQFEDLVSLLGSPYRVTNDNRYSCVKSTSFKGCDYSNNGASQDSRIVYNTHRLDLIRGGSLSLDSRSVGNGSKRYLAWAEFTQSSTGKQFIFATAHFEPGQSKGKIATRVAQVRAATAELNTIDHGLPVIWGSDLASSKLTHAGNKSYDAFIDAGFKDPLGNYYKAHTTNDSTFVTGSVVNEQYFTLNNFAKAPKHYSNYSLGAHLDYILVKPKMQVTEWEQVLNLTSTGKFAGTIPSDHNMVRATIILS